MPELLLSLLIPYVWGRSATRFLSFLAVFACYLWGAREEPLGMYRVLPSYPASVDLLVWVFHAGLLTLPWTVFWTRPEASTLIQARALFLALTAGVLPPFGLLGWLHPLTISGWIYPDQGFLGLGATYGLLLALLSHRWRRLATWCAFGLLCNGVHVPLEPPAHWVGINTHLPRLQGTLQDQFRRQSQLMALITLVMHKEERLVLPEDIAGQWTAAEDFWWQSMDPFLKWEKGSVLIGAQAEVRRVERLKGALFRNGYATWWVAHARQPIPLAEWRPWMPENIQARWWTVHWGQGITFNRAAGLIDGHRLWFSFCYEDLLTLPALLTMTGPDPPDLLVSVANLWWTRGMHEPDVQRLTIEGWARLWHLPLIRAVNLPP